MKILLFLFLFTLDIFAAKIIFLNGNSSAGKTTIAQELQKLSDEALFRTGIDHFCDMILRERYDELGSKAEEGWKFSIITDHEDHPYVQITLGSLAKKVAYTMPQVIKCLADNGHDVVVDEVLIHDNALELRNYVKALKEHTVYFIGVYCSLDELERREQLRADRMIGLARGLHEVVHQYEKYYDITIDTTHTSPTICAQEIWNSIEAISDPQGFKKFESEDAGKL